MLDRRPTEFYGESMALSNRTAARPAVRKTYKLYINGAFVRSERGRYLQQMNRKGAFVANYAWATRKDLRNALVAARAAQAGWATRTAFNRSLILYRMAEMLEDRREVFETKLVDHAGYTTRAAQVEVDVAIDRIAYYAGWADKYAQVISSVNPIAAPYFNFSTPEPTGVVVLLASQTSPLLGLVSGLLPIILSGNTCVAVVENPAPTLAIDLAEVIATSDVPAGVINLLTGHRDELIAHIGGHMDVNAISCFGGEDTTRKALQEAGAENVKRFKAFEDPPAKKWQAATWQSLYHITPFVEMKTAWHPIGV